jgi:alpha-L-fucosidase
MPPGNAIIFKDTIGRLWMVWGRMEGSRPARRGTGWSHCRLMIRTSKDNGYTWSEEREWPDSFSWLPRNPPITLTNGQLVLPMSLNNPLESGGVLLRLNPDNETWSRLGYMPDGEQMTVIHRTNGSLFALGRSQPYMLGSESADGGVTWSKPVQTPLKCPDSGNCMIRLASGRLVLAHNDCNGEDRANLAIQQSEDEGKSWVKQKFLEVEPNLEEGEYSYPCLIQTSDGMIHITYTCRRYTIKHAAFSEGWLTNLSRPN